MNKNTATSNTASRVLSVLVLFGLLFSLFAVQGTHPASAQVEDPTNESEYITSLEHLLSQDSSDEIILLTGNYDVPDDLITRLKEALANNKNELGNATVYGIVYYEEYNNWAWINIEVGNGEYHNTDTIDQELFFFIAGFFAAKADNDWTVLQTSDKKELIEMFDRIPKDGLTEDELNTLNDYYLQYGGDDEVNALSGNLLFPWDKSQNPWKIGSLGIHDAGFPSYVGVGSKALDFVPQLPLSTPAHALAMEDGYIDLKIDCDWNTVLIVRHDGYSQKFIYHHIQKGTAPAQGRITRGKNIGTLRIPNLNTADCSSYGLSGSCEVDKTPSGGLCSVSTGRHLHLGFGTDTSILIDGKKLSGLSAGSTLNSTNTNSDNSGSNCANYSYNGIVLFDGPQCAGSKLSYSNSTNLVSLPPLGWNDRARSIHVGPGWSVKTYQHDPPGDGASRCITGSMWDLSVDYFDNSSIRMDREISSIQVYNNTSCTGSNPPSGEVKLFSSANYQNQVWQGGTGFSNGPSGNAYSMSMPNGWSVKTWRSDNRGGEERCWSSNVSNLQDHGWQNAIQSIEVFSSNVCPVVPSTPALNSPTDNVTVGRYDNVVLSWNSATNATQYYAEFSGDSGLSVNSGWTSNLSYTVGNSFWGGTYQWRVKSRSSSGVESGWSTRTLYRKYGTPSSLNASPVSQNQINLSWGASADAPGNIQGYRIYRNGTAIGTAGSSATTYSDTSVGCGTNYSYTVRAYKGSLESDNSNTASATTSACAPGTPTLNAPANNTILNRTDSVSLSWNSAANATHYYAEFSGGPSLNLNSGWVTGTSWNIGSTWGGEYQWRVKSRNSSGVESGWSEMRKISIRYGTPASLSASGVSTSQINLSWGASSDAPGNIQGYRIYRNGTPLTTVGSSTTSYNDTSVTCNTSYSYTVRAYKGELESNASNTASASPINCPPVAPTNLTVGSVTASSITLSWQDNSSNESGFRVYRWGNGANGWAFYLLATVGANTATYTQSGLDCGNDFNFYEIASYNNNGESARVGWVQGATSACPPPVNDDFNTPKVITASTYTDTLDTRGATVASDDPAMLGCELGKGAATVWYRFTPSSSGQIQVDTVGSSYDTVLAIWTGARGSLVSQGCNDDRLDEYGSFIDTQSSLVINAQAGVPYYIEVAQYNESASGSGMSGQSAGKPVTAAERQIPGGELNGQNDESSELEGLAVGGTLKLNFKFAQADVIITSMSVTPGNPAAYQPTTVIAQVRNQGQAIATNFFVDLFINRQPLACQNVGDYWRWITNLQPGETRTVTIPISTSTSDGLAQGTHQLIAYADVDCLVGESNETNNQYGPLSVTVGAPLPAPVNDDFYATRLISNTPYTDTLDTRGATVAFDDPEFGACGLNAGKGTVWYKFTPAASGMVKIETAGSDYDTVLGLFTGTRGNLALVSCNDDTEINGEWSASSTLFLPVNAAVTYYINVTKYGGLQAGGAGGLEAQGAGGHLLRAEQPGKAIPDSEISSMSGGNLKLSVTGPGVGINVRIGGNLQGYYAVKLGEERREYYPLSGGPVKVESLDVSKKIVSAIRLQSYANNTLYSFVETMGVPQGLLSYKYVFPTYNNTWAPLNSQVRFGNLSATTTRIRVTIGGMNVWEQDVPGLEERRLTFPVSGGPVVIESLDTSKKIVAAIRLQSYANDTLYSFSETMGIPVEYISHKYYFPTYNNTWAPLNSQIRFGNLESTTIRIRVTIGGVNVWEDDVPGLQERRLTFPVSGGPVVVESLDASKKIVAAIRLQSYANNNLYSFIETMGVPDGLLSHKYYFPTYNNTWGPLNSQVRFGNLSATTTRIRVTIGGVNVWEDDVPGLQERRLTFAVSGGPVIIESLDASKKIVAAIRLQSYADNILYSFAETMGIPAAFLSDVYYFPTYNNTWGPLNSQLRFGVP